MWAWWEAARHRKKKNPASHGALAWSSLKIEFCQTTSRQEGGPIKSQSWQTSPEEGRHAKAVEGLGLRIAQ
jgi:hypothetical protein